MVATTRSETANEARGTQAASANEVVVDAGQGNSAAGYGDDLAATARARRNESDTRCGVAPNMATHGPSPQSSGLLQEMMVVGGLAAPGDMRWSQSTVEKLMLKRQRRLRRFSLRRRGREEVRLLHSAWMVEHGKSYNALGESERRFEIFKENLRFIDEQNALHTPLFPYPHRASAMGVITNGSSPQSLKFLVYGCTGWIGSLLGKLCEVQSKKATTQP